MKRGLCRVCRFHGREGRVTRSPARERYSPPAQPLKGEGPTVKHYLTIALVSAVTMAIVFRVAAIRKLVTGA